MQRVSCAAWLMACGPACAVSAGQLACPDLGMIVREVKISQTVGGFEGDLAPGDVFGGSAANIGDLDGDGFTDMAVGSLLDNDGGPDRGAVWILFLNQDAKVDAEQKISSLAGGFGGAITNGANFGSGVAGLGDLDGDGVRDIAVGALLDNEDGAARGAIWILFMNADGTVKSEQKISGTAGGLGTPIPSGSRFGCSVANMGDIDGDGVVDLAVGARVHPGGGSSRGAVYIIFLNPDGTVKSDLEISSDFGGFTGALDSFDAFGTAVASPGDLDGDGVRELLVGAPNDDDGGVVASGAVWVLFLKSDGTVRTTRKISLDEGGFGGALEVGDEFGSSIAVVGDLDGDGVNEIAVGADGDDDGGGGRGAAWILLLDSDGSVKDQWKYSSTEGGFLGDLSNNDRFGFSVASLGDTDGDGSPELAIGAPNDDDGDQDAGAVWVVSIRDCVTAPVVTGHPPRAVLLESIGGAALLDVEAVGDPPLQFRWRRDGKDLADDAHISGAGSPNLRIGATIGDVGLYDCLVTNGFGEAVSRSCVLAVRPSCPGDVDGDGDVDFADLNSVVSRFNTLCEQ